jgi:hypothetical protein
MFLIYLVFLFLMLFSILSCSAIDTNKDAKNIRKIGFFGAEIEFVCLDDNPDCSMPAFSNGEL